MKIEYDPMHDLLNLEFLSGVEIEESLEIDGIILDYAKDRRIVAIEVLDASKRTTQDPSISSRWQLCDRPPALDVDKPAYEPIGCCRFATPVASRHYSSRIGCSIGPVHSETS